MGKFLVASSLYASVLSDTALPCTSNLPQISWGYTVSKQRGKEYRRVDLEIIKLEKIQKVYPDQRVSLREYVSPDGFVKVEISSKSSEVLKNVVVTQKIDGQFDGFIRAKRILSKSPLIVEEYITAPYHIEKDMLYIGIPVIYPGEEMQLEYRVNASIIYRPTLTSPVIKRETIHENVVRRYSFYFSVGKVEADRSFFENLLVYMQNLPSDGEYRIRVIGYADSVGKRQINTIIAKERAKRVVSLLLRERVACLERQHYADTLTATPLDAK